MPPPPKGGPRGLHGEPDRGRPVTVDPTSTPAGRAYWPQPPPTSAIDHPTAAETYGTPQLLSGAAERLNRIMVTSHRGVHQTSPGCVTPR